jgi:hypothetical protein
MHFKRNELKYYISPIQTEALQLQLSRVMDMDKHGSKTQGYRVRSLYFDSIDDECLYQKQSGFLHRRKFRLRVYDNPTSDVVKFEIKSKAGQLVSKDSVSISKKDAESVIKGDFSCLLNYSNAVLNDIYATFMSRIYRPKVIVEYDRVAFVYPVANTRITFDKNLRSGINNLDLFSNDKELMPVILEKKQVMEVKFDSHLPAYLSHVLAGVSVERMAISKYTLSRRFHKIQKWEDN